jgi:hypothetical protein
VWSVSEFQQLKNGIWFPKRGTHHLGNDAPDEIYQWETLAVETDDKFEPSLFDPPRPEAETIIQDPQLLLPMFFPKASSDEQTETSARPSFWTRNGRTILLLLFFVVVLAVGVRQVSSSESPTSRTPFDTASVGHYFRSWRRKAAIVTLSMALAITIIGIRFSHTMGILTILPYAAPYQYCVIAPQGFAWMVQPRAYREVTNESPVVHWESIYLYRESAQVGLEYYLFARWKWELFGFRFGHGQAGAQQPILLIPYWSLVASLILFSTWLLLSRPRQAKPLGRACTP